MGVVVVQVGQGGNQFGLSLFESLFSLTTSLASEFFREPRRSADFPRARAVLVDTEPKAVAGVKRRSATGFWRYGLRSSFTQESGSGNNWAKGFCKLGPSCQDSVMDIVRREVEMCDIFSGFITSQSLAGGTGAGVGSYLLEVLKDEYPSCHILSHCIWPVEGEVSVQYYNVLLSLAHFQDLSDGLLLMKNEALMSTCKKVLGIQRPSFDDMNDVGARALASLLLPAYDHSRPTLVAPIQNSKNAVCKSRSIDSQLQLVSCTRFRPLSELLTGLCVHPKYRILALRATHQLPTSFDNVLSHSWISHLKQLKQMLYIEPSKAVESESSFCTGKSKLNYNLHRQIDKCVANLLVLRGRDASEADISLFDDKMLYPAWSKEPLKVASNSASLGKYDKFASLLSNCRSAIAPAGHALSRAQTMYASKAYIHHYLKHGLSLDTFDTSFATVQDVLTNYMDL